MFKIGLCKTDITPRAGIRMFGFGKRVQPCLGVNDPLFANAMVIENGDITIALIDCDLLLFWADFTADLRAMIEKATGISGNNIMLSYTHTHYGPEMVRLDAVDSAYEIAYRQNLLHVLVGLVVEAKSNLQPAEIKIGHGSCDIGVNRRQKNPNGEVILGENPAGPIDRSVGVCRIDSPSGKPIAAIVNFATHPVGQDVQLRKVSADYVGCTRRVVEEMTGATCVFWQGATGNINILKAESTYAHTCEMGAKLGKEAARVWAIAEPVNSDEIKTITRVIDLPFYRGLSKEHCAAELKKAETRLATMADVDGKPIDPKIAPELRKWHEKDISRLKNLLASWTNPALIPPPTRANLQAFRIGDFAWVCIPGELFTEIGMEIKKNSPIRQTFVVAYVNDWIGYLPTAECYAEGGYEVSQVCYVSPEGMKMMVDAVMGTLGEL